MGDTPQAVLEEGSDQFGGSVDIGLLSGRAIHMHKSAAASLQAAPRLYMSLLDLYGQLFGQKRAQLLQQAAHLQVCGRLVTLGLQS